MTASGPSRNQMAGLITSTQSGRRLAGDPPASLRDGGLHPDLQRALEQRATEAEGRRP